MRIRNTAVLFLVLATGWTACAQEFFVPDKKQELVVPDPRNDCDSPFFCRQPQNRRGLAERNGGSVGMNSTESAVTAGLRWLARHQCEGGGWPEPSLQEGCHLHQCGDPALAEFNVGLTALTVSAFLGAGATDRTKDTYIDGINSRKFCWGPTVKNGLEYLIDHQGADGCFGEPTGEKSMYNHAIATLAMSEAFGMMGRALYRDSAQRGVDFLVASRNPARAWRYGKQSGDNDMSVTGWCVLALKAAEFAGLHVDRAAFAGARAFLETVTDEQSGRVEYAASDIARNESWDHHETMTAIGMVCRAFLDKDRKDPALDAGGRLLGADPPCSEGKKVDYYYWHFGTMALFHCDGPQGASWQAWNSAVKKALIESQHPRKDGCLDGSWDPDRWGWDGGRVYATAINVLTLETYYRYENAIPVKRTR